jgi:hypothetical protein
MSFFILGDLQVAVLITRMYGAAQMGEDKVQESEQGILWNP